MDLDPEEGEDVEEADQAMMAAMGFGGFGSTKAKHVEGNQEGAVHIKKQRTWRQYMNRKGGFNRRVSMHRTFPAYLISLLIYFRPLDKIK